MAINSRKNRCGTLTLIGIWLVDSPFSPTTFVATGVQVACACVTFVAVSIVHKALVPSSKTKFRFELDFTRLPRIVGVGGNTYPTFKKAFPF
jgi:hypothetical protein